MDDETQDLRVPLSLTVATALAKALMAISPRAKTIFLQELVGATIAFQANEQADLAAVIGQYAQQFRDAGEEQKKPTGKRPIH